MTKLFILFTFLLPLAAFAQIDEARAGINFSTKSYKEVLAAAKASHKKVFVDAFATWCAPCKELRNHTFNDPKAAAFFNKHFINFSVDVEKGEGVELARTWQVEGLPTLLIVDENGQVLGNHTGFVDGNGLMEFAREAADNSRSKHSKDARNQKPAQGHEHNPWYSNTDTTKLDVSDAEWKKVLSPDLYAVARAKDTERPFTGKYWKSTTRGTYYCAVCGNLLFRSDAKFASSCGWPSLILIRIENNANIFIFPPVFNLSEKRAGGYDRPLM